jgi:hypothetical protein
MKISGIWKFRSIAGKVMMVLALAAMIGSIDVVPALGDDHDRRGKQYNSRYEHRGRGHHDRDRYERRDNRPYGYGYRERVYAPIYAPPPPPGIGIFFPFSR